MFLNRSDFLPCTLIQIHGTPVRQLILTKYLPCTLIKACTAIRVTRVDLSSYSVNRGLSIMIDTKNLPNYLNKTNNEWDFELWYKASEPDLSDSYFVACGIWLAINLIISSPLNGTILYTFLTNKSVKLPFDKSFFQLL